MELHNKVAVITGSSRGIGKTIAEHFHREGALLSLAARSGSIRRVAENFAGDALAHVGDVSDPAFVESMISKTLKKFGRIDILVNNAGVQGPIGPLDEADTSEWIRTVEINLIGVFLCCQKTVPVMKKVGGGKIINLSGGGSSTPRPFFTAYGASKTAIVRLTETLAEEVKEFNIQVNAIAPGAINTGMLTEVVSAGSQAGSEELSKALKQKKDGGDSIEKAASLAVFLASDRSSVLTGKLISAVWDRAEKIVDFACEINRSDFFTLRRIS